LTGFSLDKERLECYNGTINDKNPVFLSIFFEKRGGDLLKIGKTYKKM